MSRQCYAESMRIKAIQKSEGTTGNPHCSFLDLDPRMYDAAKEEKRPRHADDLKEVVIGPAEHQRTKIGTKLSHETESQLISFLSDNAHIFAWSPKDMPGIDPNFVCHKLSLNPSIPPVSQRKRRQGMEKTKAIKEETDKLLAAEFIREVNYPTWLANPVLVRKSNGRWRMCIDYTDLNKACPKDAYPLPSIGRLVDGASGYKLLSFMDAYSGYNQIRMSSIDAEKTAFMTDRSNYCYNVMPFGLKNAGATYQRLMDRVFEGEIGETIEVYVDDMVVKAETDPSHIENLKKIFKLLERHNLRLNPEKCSFGVEAGDFLGYVLTHRGIEANPAQC